MNTCECMVLRYGLIIVSQGLPEDTGTLSQSSTLVASHGKQALTLFNLTQESLTFASTAVRFSAGYTSGHIIKLSCERHDNIK